MNAFPLFPGRRGRRLSGEPQLAGRNDTWMYSVTRLKAIGVGVAGWSGVGERNYGAAGKEERAGSRRDGNLPVQRRDSISALVSHRR